MTICTNGRVVIFLCIVLLGVHSGRTRETSPEVDKPGFCPPNLPDVPPDHCPRNCMDDRNCQGNSKCCVWPNNCFYDCVEPVSREERQRHNKQRHREKLRPSTHSHYPSSNTQNPFAEDNPRGRGTEKPGQCPNPSSSTVSCSNDEKCTYDFSCRGDQKCCLTRCGMTCTPPDPPLEPVEPNMHVTLQDKKPGKCPEVPPPFETDCGQPCEITPRTFSDYACPDDQKCCPSTQCGTHVCTTPEIEYRTKPGRCPRPKIQGPCTMACRSDYNCHGRKKCCTNGCGYDCLAPIEAGQIDCPAMCRGNCNDECKNDADCGYKQLCLFDDPCKFFCATPVPDVEVVTNENVPLPEHHAQGCEDAKCEPEFHCELQVANCTEEYKCPVEPICILNGTGCQVHKCPPKMSCFMKLERCHNNSPSNCQRRKPLCVVDNERNTAAAPLRLDSEVALAMLLVVYLHYYYSSKEYHSLH